MRGLLLSSACILALSACSSSREASSEIHSGDFGNSTMNNVLVHSGQRDYVIALQSRFNAEVPDTITFAFNSAVLDEAAIATLRHQANWIKQFPELRFKVFGHADAVGSNAYNYNLGLRRANAVVAYFASQGISRSRLEALVSYGETRPVVQTQNEERRNRRTVTEVSGFQRRHPTVLNGKYAEVIAREYIDLARRMHPPVTTTYSGTGGAGSPG